MTTEFLVTSKSALMPKVEQWITAINLNKGKFQWKIIVIES